MNSNRFSEGNGLFELLPAVVRHRDSLTSGEPLKATLKTFGAAADRIQDKINASYANLFVETCGSDELACLADLIGYRPVSGKQVEKQAPADGSEYDWENHPFIALRRDVGRAIWARRRKGTAHVLGDIVHSITGWQSVVFENSREVVTTPSIRFAGARNAPGTPDLRSLVGRERIDQGPGMVPRIATAGRADSGGGRSRWHPLDVVVEGWCKRARLRCNLASKIAGKGYLAVRLDGSDLHLCAPADPCADVSQIAESVRPVYLSDFWSAKDGSEKSRIYGVDRALAIFQSDKTSAPANAAEIALPENLVEAKRITFGRIKGTTIAGAGWIVDPEKGRILPPAKYTAPFAVRYYEQLDRDVGDQAEDILRVRLSEHVPMEARAGVVRRS